MDESYLQYQKTLVRYNNPILASKQKIKKNENERLNEPKDDGRNFSIKNSIQNETEEILNSFLPVRSWEENGKLWIQTYSSSPATRQDVIYLTETLDSRLAQNNAREIGICPIRRELYNQCFDEVIRQVTISCTERGLLLLRVRNEINLKEQAYQNLYSSSIAYGLRKTLYEQEIKEKILERSYQLEQEIKQVKASLNDLKMKIDLIKLENDTLWEEMKKKHNEELTLHKATNSQLMAQLLGIVDIKK
ncbi:CLUMA_CG010659, isoform A [Clunio marinus]|uniref:CLUMA_CG010659, isoform A n=1 Tax=Clunio marinus TaxID=568069 RepID=A0A1J1IAF4_9DIPT|nr:CLUMA_CG010659, isoform A [Clunio marinus]